MVILASFQQHPLVAFGAATTLVLGAAYTLWMVKRVVFGEVGQPRTSPSSSDINGREALVLGMFALGVLALGVYPKPLTDLMDASIAQLVEPARAPASSERNPHDRRPCSPPPTCCRCCPRSACCVGAAFALLMLDLFLSPQRRALVTHVSLAAADPGRARR